MKWPETLSLVRHDISVFNSTNDRKKADPIFQTFVQSFTEDINSPRTKTLATYIRQNYALNYGDHNTPLAPVPEGQASRSEIMASRLKNQMPLPDVVFVSPYARTKQTLERMKSGWPQLQDVPTIDEYRITEQDHGLAQLYGDWRVFETFNPEQHILYGLLGEYWYRYPQGESVPDVQERLRSWVTTLTREFRGMVVLAVLHHLSILALRANLERWRDIDFIQVDKTDKPDNASVTIYRGQPNPETDGQLVLQDYNLRLFEPDGNR